jgi:hypothetical protein
VYIAISKGTEANKTTHYIKINHMIEKQSVKRGKTMVYTCLISELLLHHVLQDIQEKGL